MRAGLDAAVAQELGERGAALGAHGEQVVDVRRARRVARQPERQPRERREVARGERAALVVPCVEALELGAQHRGLQAVEASVVPDVIVAVARALAMLAELADARGGVVVAGRDRAPLAERAEVLRGVEAEARGVGERADALAAEERAVRLRCVLEEQEAVARRDDRELVDGRGATGQVHRDDGAGARADGAGDRLGVEVARLVQDVGEGGARAGESDGLGRGEEARRRGEHLVAGADAEAAQREHDRARAVRAADGVGHAEVLGPLALERGGLLAAGERPLGDDVVPQRGDLGADGLRLGGEIDPADAGRRHGREALCGERDQRAGDGGRRGRSAAGRTGRLPRRRFRLPRRVDQKRGRASPPDPAGGPDRRAPNVR